MEYMKMPIKFDGGIVMPHNYSAVEKIIKELEHSTCSWIEQFTGTGKSFISLEVMLHFALMKKHIAELEGKEFEPLEVLFASPSLAIEDSYSTEFEDRLGTMNLIKLTTALYQNMDKVQGKKFDFIIADEMHHLGAEIWGSDFKKVLDFNRGTKYLGLTATPNRMDGIDVAKLMFNGQKPARIYTMADGISEGNLPYLHYYLANVDFGEAISVGERQLNELNKAILSSDDKAIMKQHIKQFDEIKNELPEEYETINETISKVFSENPQLKKGKFIIFCPRGKLKDENGKEIDDDELILEKMMKVDIPEWFRGIVEPEDISIRAIHSKFGDSKDTLKEFSEDTSPKLRLLFTVDKLNEGKHIRDLNGLFMSRSTLSDTVFLQQLGRSMSVGHRKEVFVFDFASNLTMLGIRSILNMMTRKGEERETRNNAKLGEEIEHAKTIFDLNVIDPGLFEVLDAIDNLHKEQIACVTNYKERLVLRVLKPWLEDHTITYLDSKGVERKFCPHPPVELFYQEDHGVIHYFYNASPTQVAELELQKIGAYFWKMVSGKYDDKNTIKTSTEFEEYLKQEHGLFVNAEDTINKDEVAYRDAYETMSLIYPWVNATKQVNVDGSVSCKKIPPKTHVFIKNGKINYIYLSQGKNAEYFIRSETNDETSLVKRQITEKEYNEIMENLDYNNLKPNTTRKPELTRLYSALDDLKRGDVKSSPAQKAVLDKWFMLMENNTVANQTLNLIKDWLEDHTFIYVDSKGTLQKFCPSPQTSLYCTREEHPEYIYSPDKSDIEARNLYNVGNRFANIKNADITSRARIQTTQQNRDYLKENFGIIVLDENNREDFEVKYKDSYDSIKMAMPWYNATKQVNQTGEVSYEHMPHKTYCFVKNGKMNYLYFAGKNNLAYYIRSQTDDETSMIPRQITLNEFNEIWNEVDSNNMNKTSAKKPEMFGLGIALRNILKRPGQLTPETEQMLNDWGFGNMSMSDVIDVAVEASDKAVSEALVGQKVGALANDNEQVVESPVKVEQQNKDE